MHGLRFFRKMIKNPAKKGWWRKSADPKQLISPKKHYIGERNGMELHYTKKMNFYAKNCGTSLEIKLFSLSRIESQIKNE